MSPPAALAINCGSSSLKAGLYEMGTPPRLLRDNGGCGDLAATLGWLGDFPAPAAIGHRFVHGGSGVRGHCRLSSEVEARLRAAIPYAPLHLPAALEAVGTTRARWPQAVQVACLDTAFHRALPAVSRTYALPPEAGVERFGFHGLALESVVVQLDPLPQRLIAAHLGGGCSVTAIRDGISIDTSMGLTPGGGMMMGTRSGDLDPGVLLRLLRSGWPDAAALEDLLDRRSGLLGVSGVSGDMRRLLALRAASPRAALAVEMFCHQAAKTIAAMAAVLGGADLVVFSGGIGENAAEIRVEIERRIAFLGIPARVVPAQEDLRIAVLAQTLYRSRGGDASRPASSLSGCRERRGRKW